MTDPQPQQAQQPSGGRQPMTPQERARHAALVRWKKANPLGARLQAIREKRKAKKGGKKPAQTPEQREAQRAAEAQKNRADILNSFGSFGRDTLPDLEAMAKGEAPADTDGMIMSGLAERLENGTVVLTSEGKKLYNAASKGDRAAAKEAIDRAESNSMARDEKAKAKADKEKAKEGEEAEKPKAGGGGGDGAAKPSDEEKEAERKEKAGTKLQQTREELKEKMSSSDTGLSPSGFDAFTAFGDGGELSERMGAEFQEMGLTEGSPSRLTEAGRSLRNAIDRGDLRAAQDAIERGKAKKAEEGERAKAKEDKDKERAAEKEKRAKERLDRIKDTRDKRRPMRDGIRINATKDTDMDQLDRILDIVEQLSEDDFEIKAGKRNKGSDQALIDEGYALAEELCALFTELGASAVEEETEGGTVMEGKSQPGEDNFTIYGSAIKALDGDAIGGFAVLFGSSDMPDLSEHRDYFTKSTDYWLDRFGWPRPMTYHHGLDPDTADDPIVGQWTKAIVKDEGIWLEGQLNRAHRYHGAIKELVRRGYLKLSSDSAPQWVLRERQPNGANEVKRWPLITASPTVIPAEPRIGGLSFKTLLAELGLDAIEDDTPEAATDESERPDGAKALNDRTRRALIELDLLTLETIA